MSRPPALAAVVGSLLLAAPGVAQASQLVDRSARSPGLAVDGKGRALVTYRKGSRVRHVLVWGAVDARPPDPRVPQERFRLDYAGGWGRYGRPVWRTFGNACRPYDGPALPFLVAACTAPDGSYWALQSWRRLFPNLGFLPWLPGMSPYELHVSHWRGDELARIEAWPDWVLGRKVHHLFGRLTYRGQPVYGFRSTRYGARLDRYGRLIYLDTYDSRYGSGWRRENSFLTHNPTGIFCYGFYRYDPGKGGYKHPASWPAGRVRGPGNGTRYRLTAEGPGVTPDVSITIAGLHDYDPRNPSDVAYEARMNTLLDSIVGVDKLCRQH